MTLSIQLPLIFHLMIELPASISFLLFPQTQLPGASEETILILRNFGGLLLSTNLLVIIFLLYGGHQTLNDLGGWILLCLGSYHFWPIWRAWIRIKRMSREGGNKQKKVLGGPVVHFWVHLGCLVTLCFGGLMNL
ncbi:hypothetical protein QBC38DRAFT_472526 [Podospora fimiseda]|uniref:Uncharacterized protein n=1 Tax=Podospora fimiseda TaxID=252190 RepID=A0AAN7GXZ6_9PEZI|nr:hypothetical protein QBC38DRAFT_472526 [Podospora fimiseda]